MSGEGSHPTQSEVRDLAAATEVFIKEYLGELGVEFELSRKTLIETAFFFYRDLYRIRAHQSDQITAGKFAGYLGFWIRKLKPISRAFAIGVNKSDDNLEILEINEFIGLQFAMNLLVEDGKGFADDQLHDPIRRNCTDETCDGKSCLLEYFQAYVALPANVDYIIYSMRHRTFGPHHLVTILEHLVFGACRSARAKELLPDIPG